MTTKPLPWMEAVWTWVHYTEFGTFIGTAPKGMPGTKTGTYWLVPGTEKEPATA